MDSTSAEEHYSLVSDSDDSTITGGSIDSCEKGTHPPRRRRRSLRSRAKTARADRWQGRLAWLRWLVVVLFQSAIIGLLLLLLFKQNARPPLLSDTPAGGDINGLYTEDARIYRALTFEEELYMPDMTNTDEANREAVRQRWNELMPLGSGSIAIPDWTAHPLLGAPITDDPLRSGPIYEASWTHALHCLYYSIDSYHQLLAYGRTGNESASHASHCFEYLRQNILCSLDMTLEGSYSAHDAAGGQMHVCRDREKAVRWIEERRLDDVQDIIGP